MTRCRSSRLLPETRTASPWICDLTFGNSSRISLVIFLATSSDSPRRSPIRWRTLLPPASSTLPQSKILSDRLRRIAFDSMRSLTAAARYSSSVTQDELVLGLGQVDGHALEVEAGADLATDLVERVAQLLLVEVADDVERLVSGHRSSSPLPGRAGRRGHRPFAEPARSGRPPRSPRSGSRPSRAIALGPPVHEVACHAASTVVARDPVAFHRELDVALRSSAASSKYARRAL